MTFRKFQIVFILLAIAACLTSISTAAVFDLATDFSSTNNPNGAWTYGTHNGAPDFATNNGIVPFSTMEGNVLGTGNSGWSNGAGVPVLSKAVNNTAGLNLNLGQVFTHNADFATSPGTAVRWTAPNAGPVRIEGALWHGYDQPAGDRIQRYKLVHNGSTLQRGGALKTIQGANKDNPLTVVVNSLNVNAGDTIDLVVGPASTHIQDWMGMGLTITENSGAAEVPDYHRGVASDFYGDWENIPGGVGPANNPLYDWSFRGPDGAESSLLVDADGNSTAGAGPGWSQETGSPTYAITRAGQFGTQQPGLLGHGPAKVVWTAPSEINLGGVELTGFIQQVFEANRQMGITVTKNGTEVVATLVAPSSAQDQTTLNGVANLASTLVAIQPGDTLTIDIANTGGFAHPADTFTNWDLVIRETSAIPEPGSLLLCLLAVISLCQWRPRCH